ncbi:MAG: hypothetical protein K2Y14_10230 [Burkholderiales bacterium]|nr:hypothetical protein [Burkholderiales bacterium]
MQFNKFNKNTCLMLLISAGIVACNSGSNGTTPSDTTISKSTTGIFSGTNPVKNLGWNVVVSNTSNESYVVTGIGGQGNQNWHAYDFDHKQIVPPHDSRIFYTEASSDGYQNLRVYPIPNNSDPENFQPTTWKSVSLHEEADGQGNYIINDDNASKGLAMYNHPKDLTGIIGGGSLFYASIDGMKSGIVTAFNWLDPSSAVITHTPAVADSYLAGESAVANVILRSPAGAGGDYLRTREDKTNQSYKDLVEKQFKDHAGAYINGAVGSFAIWYFSSEEFTSIAKIDAFRPNAKFVLSELSKITVRKEALVRSNAIMSTTEAQRLQNEINNQITPIIKNNEQLFNEYLSQPLAALQAKNKYLDLQLEFIKVINEYDVAFSSVPNASRVPLFELLAQVQQLPPEKLSTFNKVGEMSLNELLIKTKGNTLAPLDLGDTGLTAKVGALSTYDPNMYLTAKNVDQIGFGTVKVKDLTRKWIPQTLPQEIILAKEDYAKAAAKFATNSTKEVVYDLWLDEPATTAQAKIQRAMTVKARNSNLLAEMNDAETTGWKFNPEDLKDPGMMGTISEAKLSTTALKGMYVLGRTLAVAGDVAAVVVPLGLALNDLYAKDKVTTSFTINNDGSLNVGYMASVRYGTYLNSCMYDLESSNKNTLSAWCLNNNMQLESAIDGTPIMTKLDVNTCKDSEDIWNKNGKLQCVSNALALNANQLPVGDYANSCSELSYVDNVLRGKCKNSHGALVSSELYTEKLCDSSMSVRNNDGYLECGLWQIGSIKINSNNNTNAPKGSYQNSCHIRGFDGVILAGSCKTPKGDYDNTVLNYPAKCAAGSGVENINGDLRCQTWR